MIPVLKEVTQMNMHIPFANVFLLSMWDGPLFEARHLIFFIRWYLSTSFTYDWLETLFSLK